MTLPTNIVFLLGLPRSGSTWLTNIFDAHRETTVFMEPFAPTYGIFPEFPSSSLFLDESTPALQALLQSEMPARLAHFKHLLLPASATNPSLFKVERALTSAVMRARAVVPEGLYNRARKTQLLNLNRMDDDAPLVRKAAAASTWVIKELRLSGKLPLLRAAYPQARMLGLIRHPAANVQAILSWFKRGRLSELRRELQSFVSVLAAQKAGARYERELALCRSGSEAHTVALYWRVCSETMVEQLEQDERHTVVTYEELACSPRPVAARLFERCNLAPDENALGYVDHSSTTSTSKSGRITTLRDSATHYKAWQAKLDPEVGRAVSEVTASSPLLARFERFYG